MTTSATSGQKTAVAAPDAAGGGMSFMSRAVLKKFYAKADGDATWLPWHRDTPDPLLVRAAKSRAGGRALDVGCGSGVFSAYLAREGFDVTAIDMLDPAIEMARELAAQSTPDFQVLHADVLTYAPTERFDLVYDSGCLHGMGSAGAGVYRQQLRRWLRPGADYVLSHFGKRHAFDWRPIGPHRRSQAAIQRLFGAYLELLETESEIMRVALPIGPRVLGTSYWFRAK